jgi:RNA polymerase sigma factor (sigma-70 family)
MYRPVRDPQPALRAQHLLRGIADNVDDGFADLVRTYERTVYNVALRVTGSPSEAEDLVSECFLRAFQALRDFPEERVLGLEPRGWLLTILLNTWRNGLRNASRRVGEVVMAELPDHPDTDAGVETHVLRRESAAELNRLLAGLPAVQRSAIILRHLVGLSISEIAVFLDCPAGTVKSHISRGMSSLRRAYAQRLETTPGNEDKSSAGVILKPARQT